MNPGIAHNCTTVSSRQDWACTSVQSDPAMNCRLDASSPARGIRRPERMTSFERPTQHRKSFAFNESSQRHISSAKQLWSNFYFWRKEIWIAICSTSTEKGLFSTKLSKLSLHRSYASQSLHVIIERISAIHLLPWKLWFTALLHFFFGGMRMDEKVSIYSHW